MKQPLFIISILTANLCLGLTWDSEETKETKEATELVSTFLKHMEADEVKEAESLLATHEDFPDHPAATELSKKLKEDFEKMKKLMGTRYEFFGRKVLEFKFHNVRHSRTYYREWGDSYKIYFNLLFRYEDDGIERKTDNRMGFSVLRGHEGELRIFILD